MLDHRFLLGAAVAGAVFLGGTFTGPVLTQRATAQTAASAAVPDGALAINRLNELGPEGQAIARGAGLWDMTETVWASPGAAPVTTTGLVAERRMMGSLLQEFVRPPADTAHEAISRTDGIASRPSGRSCSSCTT